MTRNYDDSVMQLVLLKFFSLILDTGVVSVFSLPTERKRSKEFFFIVFFLLLFCFGFF